MKHEKSCGAISYRMEKGEAQVLLICNRYGGHWAFPKGHMEQGETEQETAIREVQEETGAQVKLLPGYREVVTYSPAKGVIKDVVLFVGEITGGTLRPQPEEIRMLRMLPVGAAMNCLTFPADRELLEKAKKYFFRKKC